MNPFDRAALARIEKLSIFEPNSGCQLWIGHENSPGGYGRIGYRGRLYLAHRLSYESAVGPVPEGLQLDHLCRVRCCVNPKHLEPVTGRENILRGTSPSALAAKATHCKSGHPLSGDNMVVERSGQRRCRTCQKKFHDASALKKRGVAVVARGTKTCCPSGHPLSGPNLYTKPNGTRQCRTCARASAAKFREKHSPAPRPPRES